MKSRIAGLVVVFVVVVAGLVAGARLAVAQGPGSQGGKVIVPDTTVEQPEHVGKRAHTNHLIFVPSAKGPQPQITPSGVWPATIRTVYNLPSPPSLGNGGGAGVIAIVDAYDYPTAQSDFDNFSSTFGLPSSGSGLCNGLNPCFVKVYGTVGGVKPNANCGWAQEAALDIEWAHAMAPNAQIVLVEANSSSFSDLLYAVDVATKIVNAGGYVASGNTPAMKAGEVSMSWGGSEFRGETSYDGHFNNSSNVVYFAASGDSGGKTIYPSASPYVVSAGGTTLTFSGSTVTETGWSGSGGGPSKYEARPGYQKGIVTIVGSARGTPDFSFDADPNSGVSVYDSTPCGGMSGWMVFGGTSVSSPSLSGIVNAAFSFSNSSTTELGTIYGGLGTTNFRDIKSGNAGKFSATTGWDFVTGVGSDLTLAGK